MAEIRLKNLAHSYLPHPAGPNDYALKQIDHVWEDGKAYALLGPSGCGKSTLLNIISGLLTPSEGSVTFDDVDVTRLPTEERQIAQVFQFPVVYDTMTVYDNLAFPLKNRGHDAAEIDKRVRDIAEILEMTDELGKKARGLTADAKQKISLGRGLVRQKVSAILFDEPLTVIDPHLKWMLRMQLKSLHKRLNRTMIYVTHDQTEALTFADKVVVMYEGNVVQMGTPQELFERPAHTFVGYFIGSPGMNVLPAHVDGRKAHIDGHDLILNRTYSGLSGSNLEIGVRPEFTKLSVGGSGLPITVRRIEDVGRYKIVRADFYGHDINIMVPEGEAVSPDVDRVSFDMDNVHVYSDSWIVDGEAV